MVGLKNKEKDFIMMIIAFSKNTSKILPHMLCRHFRHCAPIICNGHDLIMYQFIKHNHIEQIHIKSRDIAILHAHGWEFIYISPGGPVNKCNLSHVYSCVDLSKRIIGLKSIFIQTPYMLYKHINKK